MNEPLGKGIIVIPAFNEAETLPIMIRELEAERLGLDILVVNDGSSDNTADLLGSLPVKSLTHPINLGYGAAVQTGMMYADRTGYDFLILMDADGQHVPSQIRLLTEELARGKDIVIGSRLAGGGGEYQIPFMRRAGISFFSFLARLLGGMRILDVTSGFQAMRKNVFSTLAREYPVDFPDSEVVVLLGRKRYRVAEVPVVVRARMGGRSMYSDIGTVLYYPFKSILSSFIVLLRLMREQDRR